MGMRPVVELMFADFATIAMDAIVNHAAKISYMYGGELSAPMVVRTAYGAGVHFASHHSQSVESWLANVPGLTIAMPSTPYDAKGMIKAALRCANPVIFLEHKVLYNKKGPVPEEEYLVPIGKAEIRRPGEHLTIVATGLMVDRALSAAEELAQEGVSAEVMDLRSIQPLDEETVLESVMRTNRLVIVHEAPVRGGFGGEIAAVVADKAFGYLDAPIQRVGAPWTPVPFSPPLEDAYLPKVSDILQAARLVTGGVAG